MDGGQYSYRSRFRHHLNVSIHPPTLSPRHPKLTHFPFRTLAATLYYLLHNPHTLRTLETEILNTFTSSSEIRMGPKMQSCTYLRAIIDETMRMTPAVGGVLPREILPGGLSIPALDLELPAGIDVGCPIYAIHHHPDYVVSPFVFDPSRWLSSPPTSSNKEAGADAPPHPQSKEALLSVFNPFSIGHRACLGKIGRFFPSKQARSARVLDPSGRLRRPDALDRGAARGFGPPFTWARAGPGRQARRPET